MNLKPSKLWYFTIPLVVLVAFSWSYYSKFAKAQIDEEEYNALVDLYTSTNGANWKNNTGWNMINTPCDWYGVSCDSGHVTKLNLNRNNLSGPIPESLGKLGHLKYLWMFGNQLSGSIPESLGKLSNLKYLELNNNQLSGYIPESLGKLSNLQLFFLQNNELCGYIPLSLMNLKKFRILIDMTRLNFL